MPGCPGVAVGWVDVVGLAVGWPGPAVGCPGADDAVGPAVGCGEVVGWPVGATVGAMVGWPGVVGVPVGAAVGAGEGWAVGAAVGADEGWSVGAAVAVGATVGAAVGTAVAVGLTVGAAVGAGVEPSAGLVVEWTARRVTESGPMPSSLAATTIEMTFSPLGLRNPAGIVNEVCGPRSPM